MRNTEIYVPFFLWSTCKSWDIPSKQLANSDSRSWKLFHAWRRNVMRLIEVVHRGGCATIVTYSRGATLDRFKIRATEEEDKKQEKRATWEQRLPRQREQRKREEIGSIERASESEVRRGNGERISRSSLHLMVRRIAIKLYFICLYIYIYNLIFFPRE